MPIIKGVILLIIGLMPMAVIAQYPSPRNYKTAIEQGDIAFSRGEYKTALKKYFAAEGFDPSKREIVRLRINIMFERIDRLRIEAVNKEKELQAALIISDSLKEKSTSSLLSLQKEKEKSAQLLLEALEAKKQTQAELEKLQLILSSIQFYQNRFALLNGIVYKEIPSSMFFFIDNDGNRVSRLGLWNEASQFNEFGFARVVKYTENQPPVSKNRRFPCPPDCDESLIFRIQILIDTFGNQYQLSNQIPGKQMESIAVQIEQKNTPEFPNRTLGVENIKVIILHCSERESGKRLIVPREIARLKDLKALILAGCGITSLPEELGDLKNLTILNLTHNNLDSIPGSINELSNLTTLNLSSNNFHKVPSRINYLANLVDLDLSMNNITTLPIELSLLKKLKKLNIKGNKIPKTQIAEIQILLPQCEITY